MTAIVEILLGAGDEGLDRPPEVHPAGWYGPTFNSRKAHYFLSGEGLSLCRKWGCIAKEDFADCNDDSPHNCADCQRRVAILRRKRERGNG